MQPKAKYRKDYRAPDFTITDIYLDFQLDPNRTFVTSTLTVERKNNEATHLRLDGHSFDFLSLKLNGEAFDRFEKDNESLTIDVTDISSPFELQIETGLNPAQNTSLQGLYQSGDGICTQCEAEGFRQITYMLDRPDVLAKYRTKITASKKK